MFCYHFEAIPIFHPVPSKERTHPPASIFIIHHPSCAKQREYSDSSFARIHYFYTAGSRNGLESGSTVPETTKMVITRQIRIQKIHSTREIRYQGGAKPLGQVLDPKWAEDVHKIKKVRVWACRANPSASKIRV